MKIPEPAWAVLLAILGVIVALACLFHSSSSAQVIVAVLAIASNLVSGALGAFAGHAGATSTVNAPNSNVSASAGGDPTFPPTQPK